MKIKHLTVVLIVMLFFLSILIFWAVRLNENPDVIVAVIAASGTILASVFAVVMTQYNSKTRELADAHRTQKRTAYTAFSDLVFSILSKTRSANETDDIAEEVKDLYLNVSKQFMLYASTSVIKSFLTFRTRAQAGSSKKENGMTILTDMDKVFRTMRDDLELDNTGLSDGDLVKMFLTDPEELDRLLK